MMRDRTDYFIGLAHDAALAIDIIDKRTFKVLRSIPLRRSGAKIRDVTDLAQDPSRPLTYVAVRHDDVLPHGSLLLVDENKGELRELDIFSNWVCVSQDGNRLFTGYKDVYKRGSSFHINPNQSVVEMPGYGSVDMLLSWDPRHGGELLQGITSPGANGHGVRLSADGSRIVYLLFTGSPQSRGNLVGWSTRNFKAEPVLYQTEGRGSTTELAFHPWLPILGVPGSGAAVLFDQDTGKLLENKLLMPTNGLAQAKVERLHFAPDGEHLVFVCTDPKGRFLHSVSLRLSDEELAKRRPPVTFEDTPSFTVVNTKVAAPELTALAQPRDEGAMTPKEIGRQYLDAVVSIKTDLGSGSGFLIGPAGYVMTSAHLVEDADKLLVVYNAAEPGKAYHGVEANAKLLGIDSRRDIALLKIDIDRKLPAVRFAFEETVESGESVVVIGNPGAGAEVLTRTMTSGIVSNPDRTINGQPYIQMSAAVNPGNSGGAMFDSRGLLVGMVNLKARMEGAAFATPVPVLREFLKEMTEP